MTKRLYIPAILLFTAVPLLVGIAAAQPDTNSPPKGTSSAKTVRLEEATMIIEVNDTDGDAGLQVFLDGEPWRAMKVTAPDGRTILDVHAKGKLKNFGLTELFSESNEPEFKELPLNKFKKRFPAGQYRFSGRTIEGQKIVAKAKLSHDTPSGPEITAPTEGATVPRDNAVARWNPVVEPGIEISGYRVIVERENPLRVFNADLPASQTSVTIPSEYLEPGVEYKIEIQSIEKSGNQTISELPFRVS
jgi:hypothetical protein